MDIERTMQFILEHQAAHAAAIAQHDEMLKELKEAMREQRDESREQQKLLHQTQDLLHETVKTLRVLGESAIGAIERLTRAQDELRDDLNVLLKTVDGLVRRRDEGTASSSPNTPTV
jgi:DNA anti-recombination protein RmuC